VTFDRNGSGVRHRHEAAVAAATTGPADRQGKGGQARRQRVTAVAMALLIIPVVVIVLMLTGRDQAAARALLGSPIVAILLTLFIIAGCVHMKIGVQVVIEDYVHGEATKLLAIIANNFFSFAVGLASIFAILKLAVGS